MAIISLPPNTESALALAIAQLQSNPVESLRRLEQLTAAYRTGRSDIASEIGHAFLLLDQAGKAVPWYRQAIAKESQNWSYLAGLGNAWQMAGRADRAAESFEKAVSLAPRETDLLFSLSQAYAKLGKLADAVRTLRSAASRNPESAAAYNDLGGTLLRMGNMSEAETAMREAVRIQPELASLRMNLADALIRQGKLPEAKGQLDEAIRTGGHGETAESAWFAALQATGSAEQARKSYDASFAGQLSGAHNNLGTLFASENKPDDAIREYRLAVAADPRSILAQFNLGLTLFGQGLKTEAIPYLKNAGQSPDPRVRDAARFMLAK